jgi:hypothetical protein
MEVVSPSLANVKMLITSEEICVLVSPLRHFGETVTKVLYKI